MKTVKELVEEINAAGLYSVYAVEDEIDLADAREVDTVERDEHRWYVLGTKVFQVGDEFIGVRGPVSLKSESMDYSDVGEKCEAFEMVEVPTVTYKRKVFA